MTLGPLDRELADTATVGNQLAKYLGDSIADDDPRMGVVFGLRARVQALSCRKTLDAGDMSSADSAMKQIYSTVNLGRNVATGTVAATLEDAYTTIKTLGIPSDAPEQAEQLLDTFIGQLEPLLDEAKAIVAGATTSS